jgi:hypothetical protein
MPLSTFFLLYFGTVPDSVVFFCFFHFIYSLIFSEFLCHFKIKVRGRRGRDRMIVGFYNYLCNQCLSPLML